MARKIHIMRCLSLILLLGITATVMAQPGGLVGYWKLDDMAGSTAIDSSGNNNNGELLNDPTWVQGFYNGALQFAPTAPSLSVPVDDMTPDQGTVAMWAYLDADQSTDTTYFFGHTTLPAYGNRIQLYTEDSNLDLGLGDSHAVHSSIATLQTETWFHLALTWNNGNYVLYLDGQSVSEGAYTGLTELQARAEFGNNGSGNADQALNGILDDAWLFRRAITESELAVVMAGGSDLTFASAPSPANEETDVALEDTNLTWAAGPYAATHDVYLGTSFDDVNDAGRDNPGNVLVSQGQTDTSYALGRLELGQTYFWRIDEVNAAPDHFIYKGPVWRFTVEPVSYALADTSITATASSTNSQTSGPEKTIDGSGLDEVDGHSTVDRDMWLSAPGDGSPWIQYEFDGVYKLDHMLIWNSNQLAEDTVGWGLKDVKIETSLDGSNWNTIEGVTQLTQAPGEDGTGPTDDIVMGGAAARYVRITITNNWGGLLPQYGLSEVRFYTIPVQARAPMPASGATDVRPDTVLSWRTGREAETHDVFVDTDANAVLDGFAPANTVNDNNFNLAFLNLSLGETYYWKVNEVNDAEDPSVWEGPVWNFNIPDPLVVDDFESYSNIASSRPYVTWRDGLDFSNPAPGGAGNGTGALVGHDIFSPGSPYFDGDIMEQVLIHGGSQSLPLYYDNSGNNGNEPYSEMTRTFSPAQDWSGNAIATLTLYFRGMEGNTGQVYVKINDTKLSYTDDAGAISRPMWEQWNIDLAPQGQASVGTDLSNVQSLTVGIENPGSGLIYVDDILLYRNAPAVAPGN